MTYNNKSVVKNNKVGISTGINVFGSTCNKQLYEGTHSGEKYHQEYKTELKKKDDGKEYTYRNT